MKTDRLEEFVKANREGFDSREPSPELWDRINNDTKKAKVIIPFYKHLLRIAAVLAIVAITSTLLWQTGALQSNNFASNISDPELLELMEAEAFYSHQVDEKLKEIKKCYYTFPELKEEIETDLNELESMYKVLKNDLEDNVSNKSVIEAMIENNRYRLRLCDDVLEQINC